MNRDLTSSADIPWEMMNSIISGKSGIDVPRLYITGIDDATDFLGAYGFQWDDAEDRTEVERLRTESIEFVEDLLIIDEPGLDILPLVRDERDVRKLLLWASAPIGGPRQMWSCCLLRVMHTFAHCGSYFQQLFSDQIREQILARFEPHIHRTSDGMQLGQGPGAIPLHTFQFRGTKSRSSLALKLLQKAENVAADIFDWVGVRFVTNNRFDALLVAKYLRVNNLIVFAHVRPGRSRNTLVDIGQVKETMHEVEELIRSGKLAEHQRLETVRRLVEEFPYPLRARRSDNPFSASAYHSIQFTVAQQIRVSNPYMGGVGAVLNNLDRARFGADFVAKALRKAGVQSEVKFLFPHEVQILDKESFIDSRSGRASHGVYKERQRYAVKKRLFGAHLLRRTDSHVAVG